MKLYKSLLFGLLVCGFAACDTTDLERDINSLKDRVEDYEAQVQKLNDDMNIIRVLLDGNKTITDYSFDGSNYTLTLSNGEKLTLTQGVVGANYPSITIGENGNWVIVGEDSGVNAVAKDGEDAASPQFKVENETWWVSYDGSTWEDLGVKATATVSGATSPIEKVNVSNPGWMEITLTGGGTYSIPVVQGLVCEITNPVLAEGDVWSVGPEGAEFEVKVNMASGDIIRPVVPADWKAEIVTENYSTLSGEQTLKVKVTPPATTSKCVVTMEVIRGVNTVTDELTAQTATTSYYADFASGVELQIGDYTLRKDGEQCIINGEAYELAVTHISSTSDSKVISADGLYFIDSDVEGVTYNVSGGSTKILVGNTPGTRTALTLSNSLTLGAAQSSLFCKNIEFTLNDAESTTRILTVNNPQKKIVFENCKFNVKATKQPQFVYITSPERTVEDLVFDRCVFHMDVNYTLLGLGANTSRYNLTLKNSLFYSSTANISAFKILTVTNSNMTGGAKKLVLQNNTFYNVHSSTTGMINGYIENLVLTSNLFENSYEPSANLVLLRRVANAADLYQDQTEALTGTISDNYGYINSATRIWQVQYGGTNPIEGTEGIMKAADSFFKSADTSTGTFEVKAEYEGLGANL